MPARDWRDVVGGQPSLDNLPIPADLARLMDERRQLETRMADLTGGGEVDPRTAALYQVRPMRERIAEHQAWQQSRDDLARSATDAATGRRGAAAVDEPRPARPASGASEASLPLRPTAADRARQRFRRPSEFDGFQMARDALGQGRGAGGFDLRRALDRAMGRGGASSLASSMNKLQRLMDQAASTRDAPRRAERKIEDDWLARRDAIGGPDLERYERGFAERAKKLLGVDTGPLAELQDRSERLRDAALGRRREEQAEAAASTERQGRARERREARRQDERSDDNRQGRARERREARRQDERLDEQRRERAAERTRERPDE